MEPARDLRAYDVGNTGSDAQPTLVIERPDHLGDEQRVAGRCVQTLPQKGTRRGTGKHCGESVDVGLIKRAEPEVLSAVTANKFFQPIERRWARGRSEGRDHRGTTEPGTRGDGTNHRERQVIPPVQVLGDDKDRRSLPQILQRVDTCLDDRKAAIAWIFMRVGTAQQVLEISLIGPLKERVSSHHVSQGASTSSDLVGSPFDEDKTSRACLVGDERGEVGLPYSGFSFEKHRRTDTCRRFGDQPREHVLLEGSSQRDALSRAARVVAHCPKVPAVGEPLEFELAAIMEIDPVCARRQLAHDIGDEHLSASRTARDPRRGVHGGTDRVAVGGHGLTGVDPDPYRRCGAGEGPLACQRPSDRLAR